MEIEETSIEQIAKGLACSTRIADFVQQMQYDYVDGFVDEFLAYLSKKVLKKAKACSDSTRQFEG